MIDAIQKLTRTQDFTDYLRELLVELCKVDTTPDPDPAKMGRAEARCFEILERELASLGLEGARCERRPINPAIAEHAHFSLLHYTKTPERPGGLSPEEAYANRANLLCFVPGSGDGDGENLALNAHVDVVHPYFPPRVEGNIVYGRGACDDKGPCVAIVGALKVLAQLDVALKRNVLAMLVIEEEPGGNGSLSLAMDRDLKKEYDSIMVLECAANDIHPANRGAAWYQCALSCPGANLFEMFAFVNEELEKEGRAIKAESRHPLFPQRPVQTCHGIIGHVGEHPSRICGEVAFDIAFDAPVASEARQCIDDVIAYALEEYIGRYGDKTRAIDTQTGKPKVDHHFDIREEADRLVVTVHGSTGHMGSIMENDGAITKMAYFVRSLAYSRTRIEQLGGSRMRLDLHEADYGETLMLEGGQGFVPTHPIEEVMRRMADAAVRGAETYLRFTGRELPETPAAKMTYDKLHNASFDGDPDSTAMQNAIDAARAAGIWEEHPITGWTVSCDARLFAVEYPDMPVLTSGAGLLAHAHSDNEQMDLEELRKSVEFLAAYILKQTGTVGTL